MIDFRYHLVAITSIFAALIAGLVIGSSLSTSEVAKKQQEALVESIRNDISMLRKELLEKSHELENLKKYQVQAQKWIVFDRLHGKAVYLIYSDNISEELLSSLTKDLQIAGANIAKAKILADTTETTLLSSLINASFQPDSQAILTGNTFKGKIEISGKLTQAQEVVIIVNNRILKIMESDTGIRLLPPLRAVCDDPDIGKKFMDYAPENSSIVIYDGDIYDSEAFVLSFYSDGGIFGEKGIGTEILPSLRIK